MFFWAGLYREVIVLYLVTSSQVEQTRNSYGSPQLPDSQLSGSSGHPSLTKAHAGGHPWSNPWRHCGQNEVQLPSCNFFSAFSILGIRLLKSSGTLWIASSQFLIAFFLSPNAVYPRAKPIKVTN